MLPKIITCLKLMPAYADTYLLQNIPSSRKKKRCRHKNMLKQTGAVFYAFGGFLGKQVTFPSILINSPWLQCASTAYTGATCTVTRNHLAANSNMYILQLLFLLFHKSRLVNKESCNFLYNTIYLNLEMNKST